MSCADVQTLRPPTQAARKALAFPIACLAILACVVISSTVFAADGEATITERRIKAAFLAKFVEYVEWPATAYEGSDTPVRIAVLGDAAMAGELRTVLSNRRLGNRAFDVRNLDDTHVPNAVQVLFVGRAERSALQSGLVPANQPVLVVAEVAGALGYGATINFVVKDAHVQFEVSLEDAERRHLKLGSDLLTVARNLRRSGE